MPVTLHAAADPVHHQAFVSYDLVETVPRRDDEVAHDEVACRAAEVEEPRRGIGQEVVAPGLRGQIALHLRIYARESKIDPVLGGRGVEHVVDKAHCTDGALEISGIR